MHLVCLSFGSNLDYHSQTVFAALSFLTDKHIEHVTVVTDYPDFYDVLGDKVSVYPIDERTIQDWRGEYDFFWRVKMKAIQVAQVQQPEQHLLYVDSDTFLTAPLGELNARLDQGHCHMHLEETILKKGQSKTERKMWKHLKKQTFAGIDVNKHSRMWNAGVIAIPKQQAKGVLQHAIEVCDALCATKCRRRLLEQFAFSLALEHHSACSEASETAQSNTKENIETSIKLKAADDCILHYWGNKPEWNAHIQRFFSDSKLKNRRLEDDIEAIRDFDWQSLAINTKIPSIKRQLIHTLNDALPDHKTFFDAKLNHANHSHSDATVE